MKRFYFSLTLIIIYHHSFAQVKWINVDSLFGPLPPSVHIYRTFDSIGGKPNIAYYLEADLSDKKLEFTVDTSRNRRLKPSEYYAKNDRPLLVVNSTFFSFATNKNLNLVVRNGKKVSSNSILIKGKGSDSVHVLMPHSSAIGISKKRRADIAWIKADTVSTKVLATQTPPLNLSIRKGNAVTNETVKDGNKFKPWKMQTAVGGGPVLLQEGEIRISNEEEKRFAGKAINDRHPRTAMGYTKSGKLIILIIEGRHPGIAEGASLVHEAELFKQLGCWEALNLDGGGSSCMLVNGKETIRVSDTGGQRAVPAVFIIKHKD